MRNSENVKVQVKERKEIKREINNKEKKAQSNKTDIKTMNEKESETKERK